MATGVPKEDDRRKYPQVLELAGNSLATGFGESWRAKEKCSEDAAL